MNARDIVTTTLLALCGAAMWLHGANRLSSGGDFSFRPNPLGLKEGPYGQVIALAMQGGVESDWHGTLPTSSSGHTCGACGHDHGSEDGACNARNNQAPAASPKSLLARLEQAATERTNPNPATKAHQFYLRRQAEERLRMAYELDPSNYANYNSYHLFLTEPMVGTRPILTDKVIGLAKRTITYCLNDNTDPRPALTAAAAAGNILELMFLHRENHTLEQMKGQLQIMDFALSRYSTLSESWINSGNLEHLSPARQQELVDRLRFVAKVRQSSDETIRRLATLSPDQVSLSR